MTYSRWLSTVSVCLTAALCSTSPSAYAASNAENSKPNSNAESAPAAAGPGKTATPPASTSNQEPPSGDAAQPDSHPPSGKINSMGLLQDTIEPSAALPPSAVEIVALDTQAVPVSGASFELIRDRQSVAEGNTSSKWQAKTDASGRARFDNIPAGHDSQYRVVCTDGGMRYGTRSFTLDSKLGTKVTFHVYPVVKNIREALVAGRTFVFVEPRDEVLSIEIMQQFHNLGPTVLGADGLNLTLPSKWKAFAANPTDPDLSVVKTADGVSLVGSIGPGQHSVAFTFQIPSSNRERVDISLNLWPNTADVQVATLARPGLEIEVEGFPNANLMQSNGRQPLLMTGHSFTQDSKPPEHLQIAVGGLPVVGPGRWVAVIGAALIALGALYSSLRRGRSALVDNSPAAARAKILDELAALERAHRSGEVGTETYTDTRELLLSAFVRVDRMSLNH